jgi:hypothetical protein
VPRATIVTVAFALTLAGRAAWAQPAPPADAEAEARAHFKRAEAYFDKQAWREALGEYRQSLALKTTKGAMANAAACLKALGQYDEALDLYEELRREFPVLPPKMEAAVAPAIAELHGLVGTLVIAGDAPDGASLFVDDRRRGTLPLAAPLRLSVGSHAVRVEKEGFEPIVADVQIAPARENVARLQAKSKKGRLRVSEEHNLALDVELDGAVVGKTPWEGLVEAGDHRVRVHGFVRLEDEGAPGAAGTPLERTEMGSIESTVTVRPFEVTPITPVAKDLDASLRVEATPAGASVAIDGEVVAHGTWAGRLPLGMHTVEVTANGFLPAQREVRLERRKQPEIHVDLARAPRLGTWGPKRNAAVGVSYALGAAGLTVSAITGAAALATIDDVRSRCDLTNSLCPRSPRTSLATASTVGLVVGVAGLVTGTLFVFWVRPDERGPDKPRPAVAWGAGLGLGRFAIEGRFR